MKLAWPDSTAPAVGHTIGRCSSIPRLIREELALEELELEDEELEEALPPEGPGAEFLRRLDEHETVPLEEDEELADI